jgi:curli biogenesis system outer membrane secretion channel CsgG
MAFALQACGPRVQTVAKVKPNVEEASELQRVAVMDFRGPQADTVKAALETMLVSHQYNGRPYFTVVDRQQTQTVMKEHARSLSGEIDPKTAARFGKQLGVQGVYFGDVMTAEVTPRQYTAEQQYCVRTNSSGRKCQRWATRTVQCTERTATVTLMPRLVDVETGRVVYRGEHSASSSDSSCGDQSLKPDYALMEQSLREAVEQVRADVAPREIRTWVSLMSEPSSLAEADAAEFARGLAFANAQRMDRACQIWRDLNSRVQGTDNALLYNVAMCTEVEGDPASALRILEEVDRRLDRPDANVNSALVRLRSTLAAQ